MIGEHFETRMLRLREMQLSDIDPMCDYWFRSSKSFVDSISGDPSKLPPEKQFRERMEEAVLSTKPDEVKRYQLDNRV